MRRKVKPRFWLFMIAVTLLVFGASFLVMRARYAQGAARLNQARTERDELILQVNALTDQLCNHFWHAPAVPGSNRCRAELRRGGT